MLLSDFGFTQNNCVSILFINGIMTTGETQHLFISSTEAFGYYLGR